MESMKSEGEQEMEEEIKIRRSENVDHNSNCHLFTSLNCSKSYSNYQGENNSTLMFISTDTIYLILL